MPGSQLPAVACSEPNCALLHSPSAKLAQKELRVVECIQPQCSRKFHAACIGWSEKSKADLSAESKLFFCDSCLAYVKAITAHISAQVKDDLQSTLSSLETRLTACEAALNSNSDRCDNNVDVARTALNARITDVESVLIKRINAVEDQVSKRNADIVALKAEAPSNSEELKGLFCALEKQYIDTFKQQQIIQSDIQTKLATLETTLKLTQTSMQNIHTKYETQNSQANMGDIMSHPTAPADKSQFQIRISGVKEPSEGLTPLQRHDSDKRSVMDILQYIDVGEVPITDMFRLGKYIKEKSRPRSILVTLASVWDRRKIISAAHKLKHFSFPVFITEGLNTADAKIEKLILKKRRELINQGVEPTSLKVRHLKLYLAGKVVSIDEPDT